GGDGEVGGVASRHLGAGHLEDVLHAPALRGADECDAVDVVLVVAEPDAALLVLPGGGGRARDGGGEDGRGRGAVEADTESVVEGVLLDGAGTAGDVEGPLAEVDLQALAHVLRVVRPRQEGGEAGADAVDVDDPLR